MQRLREATRLVHARIEASLPLLDPALTLATYTRVIEAFHGFYAPMEPRLAGSFQHHAKVPLLLADLCALGKTAAEVDALPRCAELPQVTCASHAIGVQYVFEGATLGGQIIGRHLRDGLRIQSGNGAAFFSGYGNQTGAMWKRFSHHVDASSVIDTEAAVCAAVETFEKLQAWLDAALARP